MFLNTRKFEKNLTVFFKFLNIGSHNTKLVDTGAEHICRTAHTVLHFLFEGIFNSIDIVATLYLILEYHGKIALRVKLAILIAEDVNKISTLVGTSH